MRTLLLSFCAATGLAICAGCEPARSEPPAAEPEAAPPQRANDQADVPMVRERAQVGVGRRGGEIPTEPTAGSILTTPTNVYFQAQEQVAFNISIPQAMQLFEATEGRPPQSEDEFFNRIIRENNIRLPELPDGHRYVYDVEQKHLMVEHPEQ